MVAYSKNSDLDARKDLDVGGKISLNSALDLITLVNLDSSEILSESGLENVLRVCLLRKQEFSGTKLNRQIKNSIFVAD
jgi:hypothetical protein